MPFGERAWHAGRSEYRGRAECNDFSIGIELEGTDEVPYEAAQYDSLAALIRALLAAYPSLSREHIVGHSDIAPGRKTDPGPRSTGPRLRSAALRLQRFLPRSCRQSTSVPRSCRAMHAREHEQQIGQPVQVLRDFGRDGLGLRASVHTRRSARRAIARARWQAAAPGPPPGRMNSFSGGRRR